MEDCLAAEFAGTLVKHRKRLNEVVGVFARHGLVAWAACEEVVKVMPVLA